MSNENKQEIMEAFNEAKNGKVVILTIYGVTDIEHPWVNTTPELFKEYLVIALRDLDNFINVKNAMKSIVPDLNKKTKKLILSLSLFQYYM